MDTPSRMALPGVLWEVGEQTHQAVLPKGSPPRRWEGLCPWRQRVRGNVDSPNCMRWEVTSSPSRTEQKELGWLISTTHCDPPVRLLP